jgi:hypothetical protein
MGRRREADVTTRRSEERTMLGMVEIAMTTVMALAVGIGAGYMVLELMLSALRSMVAQATPVAQVADGGNVVEFKQRSTGRLVAEPVGLERAA